jgi:PAS domain S-box-containing protein
MAAACYGGLRPACWPPLSAAITTTFFLVPRIEAVGLKPAHVVGILIFTATGWLIKAGADALRRTREGHHRGRRLRTTLRSIGDGVIVTDAAAGSIAECGRRAPHRLVDAASGRARRDLPHRQRGLAAAGRQPALEALRDGAVIGLANPPSRSAATAPVADRRRAAPVRRADGTVAGSVLVFRDVSERRRTEQTLRASEEELSDFFENASVGLHWIDADGRILRANKAELAMLGYAAGEYIGHPVTEFHADRPLVDERTVEQTSTVRSCATTRRGCAAATASIRHVLISSNARWEQRQVRPQPLRRPRRDRARQADEIRGLLAAVVESTEDAVITKSLEGDILSWNAGAQAMLGYAAEDVVGRSVNLIIPESRRDEELEILERIKDAKRVEPFETQRVARDGRIIDVSLSVSPIRDEHGGIIGASSIARDIGRRKALEQSLRDSDRRKDEFLAVLAHELRNRSRRSAAASRLRLALPGRRHAARSAASSSGRCA